MPNSPPKTENDNQNRYVVLMETNSTECESWMYFIRYDGNEKALNYLNDQINKIDMVLEDDLSTFDLDLEHFVSETTAKEMTKVELNSCMYHRKFDGKLQYIDLKLRKRHDNLDMLVKMYEKIGMGQIEDYISDEDVDSEDLTDCEDDESNNSSDDEPLVPVPDDFKQEEGDGQEEGQEEGEEDEKSNIPKVLRAPVKVGGMRRKNVRH